MELFKKKTVLEDIQDKVSAFNMAMSSAQEALDAALVREAEAKAEMESSTDLNDASSFSAAKQKLAEARTAIEMAQMRKDRIMERGAVSKSDADSAISWYTKKLQEIDKKAAGHIVDHIEEICRIVTKADEESRIVAKDYSAVMKLLGEEIPIEIRNGHPIRIVGVMANHMYITRPAESLCGGAKRELYRIAGRTS